MAVATGSFRAVPDDLAEWYVPHLDGLALGIVTAGQSGQTAATATRAVRRLKKELVGALLID